MDARIQAFTEKLHQTDTTGGLAALLAETAVSCGYLTLGYIVPDAPDGEEPFHVSSHPQGFEQRYFAAGHLANDPFVRRARRSFMPFVWGTADEEWAFSRDEQALVDDLRAAGMTKALFIPVHSPDRRFGLLVAASRAPDHLFHEQNRTHAPFLHLVALHLHDHVLRTFIGAETTASLTARERQVLGHFARGATAVQVAAELGISPRTVTFHIENAKRKLGTPTIAGAVARAVSGGLLAA